MAGLNSILAIAMLTLSAVSSQAGTPIREETVYDGHVTLEIPVNWHEIPEDLLELHSLYTTELSGGRIAELYRHGYRPGDPEIDFALPQILIQIRESGRLSYRTLLHLPPPDTMQGPGGPIVEGLVLDEAFFDRDRHLLRVTNTLGVEREIRISVMSASFLTERGFFTLHCYAYAPQATAVAPIFERVVDSVQFDGELRYRPRLGDLWPPRPSTLAFAAAFVSLAILIFLVLRRHGRRRS